jgi:hypothetical protein
MVTPDELEPLEPLDPDVLLVELELLLEFELPLLEPELPLVEPEPPLVHVQTGGIITHTPLIS